jgi:HPt (histidine-containing phosphotransfer) domain-containing protein
MYAFSAVAMKRTSTLPQPAAEPVIDAAHLRRMTLGEKSLENEVLQLFDRQADILMARMNDAPPEAIMVFAHTLKGSARGIGAWSVAAAAEAVEGATDGTGPESLAEALDRLAGAIGDAQAAIARLLAAR